MRLLPDTHLLMWAAEGSARLSKKASALIQDEANEVFFSAVSIWEIAIKHASGKAGFNTHPAVMRAELFSAGYREVPVTGLHAIAVGKLPELHKDPFDRLLVAQADVEGLTLITADRLLKRYPGVKGV